MKASDWIALAAVVIALSSAVLHLVLRRADRQESRHTNVITALQGDKEAVGYEAYRIGEEGWPEPSDEREQVRDALCLALVFESSDRTRAMIHSALRSYPRDRHEELGQTLLKILAVFDDAQALGPDWDLRRGWRRLVMLGTMLDIPEVVQAATGGLHTSEEIRRHPSRHRSRRTEGPAPAEPRDAVTAGEREETASWAVRQDDGPTA
jgi:hypothetical protein